MKFTILSFFRPLHHCHVPQVPSRALRVLILPQAAQQRHIQRTERQTLLSRLLRQAFWLRKLYQHPHLNSLGKHEPFPCYSPPQNDVKTDTTHGTSLESGRHKYPYSSVNLQHKFIKERRKVKMFYRKYNIGRYHAFFRLQCPLLSFFNRYYPYFPQYCYFYPHYYLLCCAHQHPCFLYPHCQYSYCYPFVHNMHKCYQPGSPCYHYYSYSIYHFEYYSLIYLLHDLCPCFQLLPCLIFEIDFVISYHRSSVICKNCSNCERVLIVCGKHNLLAAPLCLQLQFLFEIQFFYLIYILSNLKMLLMFFQVYFLVIGTLKIISSTYYLLMLISIMWLKYYLITSLFALQFA